MARFLDMIFFIFFLTHIPISILVDFQALVPREYYPKQLLDLKDWYCETFRDNLMKSPPAWFQSLIFCEMFLQLPFFFVAAYGYLRGASKCKWLRIPAIVYGIHVATTLFPITAQVMLQDTTVPNFAGPRTTEERLTLLAFYFPYFIFPLAVALDAIFSSAYKTSTDNQSIRVNNKTTKSSKKAKSH